jgi:hypothetical protein
VINIVLAIIVITFTHTMLVIGLRSLITMLFLPPIVEDDLNFAFKIQLNLNTNDFPCRYWNIDNLINMIFSLMLRKPSKEKHLHFQELQKKCFMIALKTISHVKNKII